MNDEQLQIIKDNPIGDGLERFRMSFSSICHDAHLPPTIFGDVLERVGHQNLGSIFGAFLKAAQKLPAADLLPASIGPGTLRDDLLRLELSVRAGLFYLGFDVDLIKPLLKSALIEPMDDALIWSQVYSFLADFTSPLRPAPSRELGPKYVGLRNPHATFLYRGSRGRVRGSVQEGYGRGQPAYSCRGGWDGWLQVADKNRVLSWFADLSEKLGVFAEDYTSTLTNSIPGERKGNRSADIPSEAWLDIGRYQTGWV
ncbi:uncharacterized protein C8A04DRAFT_34131 [Dichotomopilus funicola]|uniref:Uncharacterized protein n=1 Tax=Dichotomopilus funicola TaxID=1934379 RepID=A0AAN6VAK9_9PEZI|nr:hypothetical protein C8A04DRAFT_34131 [Dichotomopilus funicola]